MSPQSNLGYLEQSGRKGNITWGQIDRDPEILIPPRFILETKIGDPTRMGVEDIKLYWQAWGRKQTNGDSFSFLSDRKGKQREQQEQEEEEQEEQEEQEEGKGQDGDEEDTHTIINKSLPSLIPESDIDSGIPLPCECDTSTMRTTCLQQLAPKSGSLKKTFHKLIGLVDALEVSPG